MTHVILAFDPGETTGFAEIEVTPDGKDFTLVRCEEVQWHERHLKLQQLLYHRQSVDVVVETFRLFPHKALPQVGSEFPSVRVIGVIETFCFINGYKPSSIKYQEPGDIARVMVPERDMPIVAGSPHRIDAYRHARLYFIKHFTLNPFS